jgi:hypothetical protein
MGGPIRRGVRPHLPDWSILVGASAIDDMKRQQLNS